MSAWPDLTPAERRLCALLRVIAERGEPCPTNEELADMMGYSSKASPSTMMKNLDQRGVIAIQRFGNDRVVRFTSDGLETAIPTVDRRSGRSGVGSSLSGRPPGPGLSESAILERRETARRERLAREARWLEEERRKYRLPRRGRPLSGMPA